MIWVYIVAGAIWLIVLLNWTCAIIDRIGRTGPMMWVYTVAGAIGFVVLLGSILNIINRIGAKTTMPEIGQHVFICLRGGKHGTEVRLKVTHPRRSVRVEKRAISGEEARLLVRLGHSDCPPEELSQIAEMLSEMRVGSVSTGGHDRIEVLCKDDAEATTVVKAIPTRVFAVTAVSRLRAAYRGPVDMRRRTLYGQSRQGR